MSSNEITNEILNHKDMNKKELYEKMILIYPKEKVNFVMYNLFQYIHKETEEKEKRKDQNSFRQDLINRYNYCIITGCNTIVCEACHIIPHSECDENIKYDVNNGLLFRVDLHKLFDNNKLKINPNTLQIELSDDILNDNSMKEYHQYNNKKIHIHEKSIYLLKQIY
jgi:hypothetical protein